MYALYLGLLDTIQCLVSRHQDSATGVWSALFVRKAAGRLMLQPTSHLTGASSMLGQSCPPLQVGLDLLSVAAESPLNLLVKVGIPVVDEVHILVGMEASSPAVAGLLLLPAGWQMHRPEARGRCQSAEGRPACSSPRIAG